MSALSQPATSQRHPLSVAVIGAGMAGRTHANAWRQVGTVFGSEGIPPIRLAAICDSYEPFARSARDSYGYERAVTDWHDIVDADDIDVVSNALHRQVAEDLVRAGKHVLCEKPLSDSLENARAMAELEANSQVVTGVGFSYRRHPSVAAIAELVRQGRLGDVTTFSGRYWCGYGVDPTVPMAWRYRGPQGSGALGDLGSHIIDVAEFVCGPIRSVRGGAFATIIDKRPPALEGVAGGRGMTVSAQAIETVENDDIAVFNMTFESGAIGTIVVSRVAFGLPNSMEFDVFGTQGRASFDLARSGEIIVDDTSTPEGFSGPRQVLSNPTFPYYKGGSSMDFAGVGSTQIEQFTYQARAFLDQVLGLDEGFPLVPSFAHGYRTMCIADAVARSAAAGGKTIDLT
ncbi:Gfo/Idh/MocA family protein [Cutibacterium acnes]|uniref:Gfo/Idh/MocA family protein n=1 Tax=Cutibacterium acnes TaxID=1747 RepID=UPI00093A4E96